MFAAVWIFLIALASPTPRNLRVEFNLSGTVDVDVTAIPFDPADIPGYLVEIEAAIDSAAPADAWSFNVSWWADQRRVVVDNSGGGRAVIVDQDLFSFWPALGLPHTTTFGIVPAIGNPIPTSGGS